MHSTKNVQRRHETGGSDADSGAITFRAENGICWRPVSDKNPEAKDEGMIVAKSGAKARDSRHATSTSNPFGLMSHY